MEQAFDTENGSGLKEVDTPWIQGEPWHVVRL